VAPLDAIRRALLATVQGTASDEELRGLIEAAADACDSIELSGVVRAAAAKAGAHACALPDIEARAAVTFGGKLPDERSVEAWLSAGSRAPRRTVSCGGKRTGRLSLTLCHSMVRMSTD